MIKSIIIEFNEKDENVLRQIFQKFKVKTSPHLTDEQLEEKIEEELIRENLRLKYVVTGEWEKMSLEEKEDAALYEKMLLVDRTDTVDTDSFLKKLQNR